MSEEMRRELFLFAAKIGALEGYLYDREKVESLSNWIGNISRMYHELSPEAKQDINILVTPVLEKILNYGEKLLEPELRGELTKLLEVSKKGSP